MYYKDQISIEVTDKMKYVYPVVIYPDDGAVGVTVPDLPGCHTFGSDTADALLIAKDAIEMWLWDAENNNENIPSPTPLNEMKSETGQQVTLVAANTDEWRQLYDTKAVKKTLSIPKWLNTRAEKANAPFSRILQEGLKEYLKV